MQQTVDRGQPGVVAAVGHYRADALVAGEFAAEPPHVDFAGDVAGEFDESGGCPHEYPPGHIGAYRVNIIYSQLSRLLEEDMRYDARHKVESVDAIFTAGEPQPAVALASDGEKLGRSALGVVLQILSDREYARLLGRGVEREAK